MYNSDENEWLIYDSENRLKINPEKDQDVLNSILDNIDKSDKSTTAVPSTKGKCKAAEETEIPKKMTAFSMYDHFKEHTQYANIDGVFHIFHKIKRYYIPMSQRELENYLLRTYYKETCQSGSLRIIKTCADIIFRDYVPEQGSAHKRQQLCFRTGYIPLSDLCTTQLIPYRENDPPSSFVAPTYLINAAPCQNMDSWNIVRNLPTPQMDKFIDQIANGNEIIEKRIWQMLGYLLTPDMQGKCFFLLQGLPNTGKSVLGNLFSQLLPDHRIASLDIDQLGKRNSTSALVNKSINISMDLPNKLLSPLAIRNIKLMTGNDDITIEHKNGTLEKHRSYCKFLFATNHALTLAGYDRGFEERIICIPFNYPIAPAERNYNLLPELTKEKDYIVSKAIAAYFDLRRNNYIFCGHDLESCKPSIRYLPTDAEDPDATLCAFVEAKCEFVPMDRGTYTEEIYHAYLAYCREHNETPIDRIAVFSRHLLKCYGEYIVKKRWRKTGSKENQWGFRGIAVEPIRPMVDAEDYADWTDDDLYGPAFNITQNENGIYNV